MHNGITYKIKNLKIEIMKTGLMCIMEVKKEVENQLNRMKLNPIENYTDYHVAFICDYNSGSLVYMMKHWKMKFEINSCGWIIGVAEMQGVEFEIAMNNK